MRHIHVELAHKKAPLELPAQEGDLPPPTAPTQGLDPGVRPGAPRHFGQEELRLQKVYQLSIFSQLGGFSTSTESHTDAQQRPVRLGVKRGLDEPQLTHKRPHLGDSSDREALEGGVLCGPAPTPNVGMGLVMGPGGPGSVYSCTQMEHRDSEGGLSPRSPPLSPSHNPSRRPTQHNHDRPIPDVFAPLSPKSPPMCDPHGHLCDQGHSLGSSVRTEPPNGGRTPTYSLGSPGNESCSNGTSGGQPSPHLYEISTYETPSPASPTSPPGPFSPPHHTELQEPGEATEWEVGLESSPPERSATQAASSSSNGLASWEKTPSSNGHRLSSGGHWPAKKRLLSPSDTGESCSEDEGPSTSKRSRLSLLASGLGPASCRSTDAKAAPYWNHLLPSAWDRPKTATDCTRSGRRLKSGLRLKSRQLRSGRHTDSGRATRSSWPSSSISRSLLGNFEESILKGRFSPSGRIEGFTAEIGASGSYCPQHVTLPVQVTYYDISEHSAPSPFLGVISLEPLGKKGYSIPKAGTIQVTLFNPNKTVVKMFLVTYNFGDMPVNHMTFLRHRIFLVPVEEGVEGKGEASPGSGVLDRKKILCYLIHLRFQSSKSGKIYLHNDIRLLFSRKSIEVDTGIPYELKSFTEVPRNPKYSPRV
ncbi:protein FAM214B [Thunnus albacares]|uniref:protein FAM214B n=1 Tax=Thunnus maccoyii TaxID=8240 RepID=UPI001C4B04B4|nr:protein FAM214B [Thunnus maccoyii]XP_042277349.1 protein FAM214B [Thunnus maccoyii]XP_042277350.1 protein FAM214B [Thunnus maccoyii]XP_042277351.1 protein FAM214B [Thunnus maccoyii]XP_042277352.1 protein FAM214B [Thunnus maccoyii]XP_042277353.1 protein FAM214B [Thunnus maccoyii]XP_042277354.1 protein FAM214B [Thunnus maccoyii]XP_042277355.1 protein FAM214B [Thunnus maccoyii]XP_042277356.1 protein FAM214B [Thunnus maccoyii]XP_044233379.1 protein FAM214B [Thunnus albacares]XP_044233388.1